MDLTWQDIKKIIKIADGLINKSVNKVLNKEAGDITDIYPTEESYYTEVLNKFNECENGTTRSIGKGNTFAR